MSKQSMHITSKMRKSLGLTIEKLINSKKNDIADAIRLCAIPNWFDEKTLALLRGEGRKPSKRTRAILAKLANLAFVSPRPGGGYTYHKNVRDLLLRQWRKNASLFRKFQELSGTLAVYYGDMLQVDKPSEKQRAEWERENMYHLLVSDEGYGIGLLINLFNRASLHYQLSTFDRLLDLADEQATYLSVGNRPWIQFFKGKRALLSGDWEKALVTWQKLEGEREQVSVELEMILAVHLSLLYKDMGKWNKAIKCFQRSLKILKREGDERGMAATCNNLGFLYKDKEQWVKADGCFRRSLNLYKKTGDEHGMTVSLNYLGLLFKDKGEWDKAIECFQRSLEILERTDDKRGMASTCSDLGFIYKDKGQWKEADKYFQRSLEILNTVGDEHGKAAIFNSLGFLYIERKEWAKAGGYFRRALKTLEKIGDGRRMADTFSYLGFLYRDKMEWEKADEHFWHALKILKNMRDERGIAVMLNNLGVLYKHKGEYEKAAYYFLRSLKIVEKVGDEMNEATTMYELALLYKDMEEYDDVSELLEKVVKISEQVGHPDLRIRKSREMLDKFQKKQNEMQV